MKIVGPTGLGGLSASKFAQQSFLGQPIGTNETNTFQLNFFSRMKIVGGTGLGGLWALERVWHTDETNLR